LSGAAFTGYFSPLLQFSTDIPLLVVMSMIFENNQLIMLPPGCTPV